jgi:hypothetical protein
MKFSTMAVKRASRKVRSGGLVCLLFGFFISTSCLGDIKLSPQWTERYLFKHHPSLLKNSHKDHVLAFYYFGGFQDYTVMGMERVMGDDYLPHHTVLIFKDSVLQGYYPELVVFPAGVSARGLIFFPANRSVAAKIDLANDAYPKLIFNQDISTQSHYINLL